MAKKRINVFSFSPSEKFWLNFEQRKENNTLEFSKRRKRRKRLTAKHKKNISRALTKRQNRAIAAGVGATAISGLAIKRNILRKRLAGHSFETGKSATKGAVEGLKESLNEINVEDLKKSSKEISLEIATGVKEGVEQVDINNLKQSAKNASKEVADGIKEGVKESVVDLKNETYQKIDKTKQKIKEDLTAKAQKDIEARKKIKKEIKKRLNKKAQKDIEAREKLMWYINNKAAKDRATKDRYAKRAKEDIQKIRKSLGFKASEEFWINFEQRKNSNILEFSRRRKPHSAATRKKISESMKGNSNRKIQRSKSQKFKDYSRGVGNLVKAGVTIDKAVQNRKLNRAKVANIYSIRNQRKYNQRMGVAKLGLSVAKGFKKTKSGMDPKYAEGVLLNAKARYLNAQTRAAEIAKISRSLVRR